LHPLREAKSLWCFLVFWEQELVQFLASTFFSTTSGFSATGAEQEPLWQDFLPKIPSTDTEEIATVVATRNENINHPP
jgi:hypothetical protein